MPDPTVIRQSTLETARCLYRFHKIHVEKVAEPESEVSQRGGDFHLLAKRYVDWLVASRQEVDWSATERILRDDVVGWNEDARALFISWSRDRVFDWAKIFATEYKIRLDADMKPMLGVQMPGQHHRYSADLDRVEIEDGHAEVVDYKSHFGVFNPTTIQSVFYPWALWKLMPDLKSITFTLDFVRWGIFRSRTFEREQLERMDSFIRNQVRRLDLAFERDEWPAEVNSKCVYCRLECPLLKQGLSQQAIGQIGTPEQAGALAQQLFALRQAAGKIQTSLRAYAMEHGTLMAGNDLRLGFHKQEKTSFKPKTIHKLNEEHGFDPLRAMNVDSREVRRIGRDYPEYVTAAKRTAKDTSNTKFTFWSASGDPLEIEEEDLD